MNVNEGPGVLLSKVDGQVLALDKELVLFRDNHSHSVHRFRRQEFLIFSSLRTSKSVEEHAQAARHISPQESYDSLLQLLSSWLHKGLLLPLELPQGSPSGREPDRIGSINVVTKDRPAHLKRCLVALGRNLSIHGRCTPVCVYDDSINRNAVATSEHLRTLRRSYPGELRYGGASRKLRRVSSLASASGLDTKLIHFAIFGLHDLSSYGANLNCALLDSADRSIVVLDDDVIVRTADMRSDSRLFMTTDADPTRLTPFSSAALALQGLSWCEADFVALHELMLGKSTVALCQDPDVAQDISSGEIGGRSRALNLNGRVLLTMLGVAGASGSSQNSWFHLARHAAPFTQEDDDYRLLGTSPWVRRSVERVTISDGGFFMNMCAGIHNHHLPPFFPVLRNMDGIFAAILFTCFRHATVGHLPWVIQHLPPTPKQLPRVAVSDDWGRLDPRLSDILIRVVQSAASWLAGETAQERLHALAVYLGEVARLSCDSFDRWLLHECQLYWSNRLMNLRFLAQSAKGCSMWRREIEGYTSAVEARLEITRAPVVADISHPTLSPPRVFQELLGLYGELLIAWPSLQQISAAEKDPDLQIAVN